ncbi:MAG TPA: class I SAM-dependent methyltransferase, partial [Methanocorpusculum sp.]|nr:class I SAM-dependent methyltransferase [Methanocorpusculum sp.]
MELPGGPTQPEVMAVSLEKLGVQPGDTVADIGCGTGTVTKAIAALAGTCGHVYA